MPYQVLLVPELLRVSYMSGYPKQWENSWQMVPMPI